MGKPVGIMRLVKELAGGLDGCRKMGMFMLLH